MSGAAAVRPFSLLAAQVELARSDSHKNTLTSWSGLGFRPIKPKIETRYSLSIVRYPAHSCNYFYYGAFFY